MDIGVTEDLDNFNQMPEVLEGRDFPGSRDLGRALTFLTHCCQPGAEDVL